MPDYIGKYPVEDDGTVDRCESLPPGADLSKLSNQYRFALGASFLTLATSAVLSIPPIREATLEMAANVVHPQLINVISRALAAFSQ